MNIADMLIHVRPSLDAPAREALENELTARIGVDCAEFEHREHPHSLVVKYDPDAVTGMDLLQVVRKVDPGASIVGL